MKRRVQWALGLFTSLAVLSSCDRVPVAPVPPAYQQVADATPETGWIGWGINLLLKCSPLPYDSTAQVIGPDGGTLTVGPHTLTVPAGALAAPTLITAVIRPDSVDAIQFGPQGLTFQQPTQLVMSYANCGLLGSLIPKRIAYTTDSFRILDLIPSLDDALNRTVTGQVSHFSQYAIAW